MFRKRHNCKLDITRHNNSLMGLSSVTPAMFSRKVGAKVPRYAIIPAHSEMSPVNFTYIIPNDSADAVDLVFSPPSPDTS